MYDLTGDIQTNGCWTEPGVPDESVEKKDSNLDSLDLEGVTCFLLDRPSKHIGSISPLIMDTWLQSSSLLIANSRKLIT